MPRDGSGVYSKPTGTTAVSGTTIESAKYNSTVDDLVSDANNVRPIIAGGTGGSTASAARTALGVEILDEDDMASDSATKLASQQSIKAFVKFSKEYQSTGQTMVTGGLLTLAHGLGAQPKNIRLYAKCTTAERGYSIGDNLDISAVTARGTVSADDRAFAVVFDATNIYIRNGNENVFINGLDWSTGDAAPLLRANWDLYVEAWA